MKYKGQKVLTVAETVKRVGVSILLLLFFVGCGNTELTTSPIIPEGNIDKAVFNGSNNTYWFADSFNPTHLITLEPQDTDTPDILSNKFDGQTLFFVKKSESNYTKAAEFWS